MSSDGNGELNGNGLKLLERLPRVAQNIVVAIRLLGTVGLLASVCLYFMAKDIGLIQTPPTAEALAHYRVTEQQGVDMADLSRESVRLARVECRLLAEMVKASYEVKQACNKNEDKFGSHNHREVP